MTWLDLTTWGRIYFLTCENFGLSVQRPLHWKTRFNCIVFTYDSFFPIEDNPKRFCLRPFVWTFKGIVHPKMNILSLITPLCRSNPWDLRSSSNKIKIFLMKSESFWPGFGTIWGWVINDRIFIFGWTIPLRHTIICGKQCYFSTTYTLYSTKAFLIVYWN